MELDPVEKGVIVDRAGVGGAAAKALTIGLSRPSEILVGDRGERKQVDLVDLDHDGTAPVEPSGLDLWSRPEPVGDRYGSVRNSIADVGAELHAAIVTSTRFLIVQHAEKAPEPGDPGLSERGWEQATAAAARLAGIDVSAIYASPLRRARETAGAIAERLGVPVIVDDRLVERMNWDGDRQSRQAFLDEWQTATEDRSFQPSSGQSSRAAGERLAEALCSLAAQHSGQTVVVIGHGGVTIDLARNLIGDDEVRQMAPDVIEAGVPNGAITEILEEHGRLRLVAVGR